VKEPLDIGASRRDSVNWIELAQYSWILSSITHLSLDFNSYVQTAMENCVPYNNLFVSALLQDIL
jgi:hypothetical protein